MFDEIQKLAMLLSVRDSVPLTRTLFSSRTIICPRPKGGLYSKRMLESLGLRGAIRVSPLHCHGVEDIDRFLRITAEIAAEVQPA